MLRSGCIKRLYRIILLLFIVDNFVVVYCGNTIFDVANIARILITKFFLWIKLKIYVTHANLILKSLNIVGTYLLVY